MELEVSSLKDLSDKQLQFLRKHNLNEDQLQIALAVDKEARKQGVNPEFVWPMVYQESKFNADAESPAGAFGVMQLMPDTSKGLKVDPKIVPQNIRGGISLIKELVSNEKIGDDPYKVLAGYNASTATRNKFYESGDLADLPDETIKHMYSIGKYYGGDLPSVSYSAPVASDEQEKVTEPPKPPVVEGEGATDQVERPRLPRVLAGAAGAATGASAGAAAGKTAAEIQAATEVGEKLFPKFKELVKGKTPIEVLTSLVGTSQPSAPVATAPEVPATTAAQAQSSGQKWGKNWGNFEANPGSSVPEAGQQWNKMQPQGKITKGLAKRFGPTLPLAGQNLPQVPTEAELIDLGRLQREARYQDYLNARGGTGAPVQAAKSTLGQLADKVGDYLKYAKYPLAGAFHGFNVGQGAADVLNRMSEKKYGEAGLSALGTAAGSAALHSAPMVATPLAGMASVIPAYLYTQDHPGAKPEAILNEIKQKGGTPNPLDYVFMPGYIGAKAARGE